MFFGFREWRSFESTFKGRQLLFPNSTKICDLSYLRQRIELGVDSIRIPFAVFVALEHILVVLVIPCLPSGD